MRRIITFFMLIAFISIGMRAAITISTASVSVGGTTYQGYGIYGAKAGELALLLSGDNSVTVQWNGANLNQLKSAEYIKVGDSQNPNVLKDEDLEALEILSGAKFLDIDGSTLDDGADITKIKAGSAIEAVTLPNNLTKEQVNGAGASLTACNPNFGSCLSLDAEMEEREVTSYPYTLGGEEYEYTGDVSALTDNGDGTYTYNVTSAERTLTDAEGYPKVTFQIPDLNWGQYTTSDGEIIVVDMGGWTKKQYKLSKIPVKIEGSAGSYYYTDPFTNTQVSVGDDSNFIFVNGVRSLVVDFSPNSKTYDFDQNNGAKYKYQYTNLAGETEYTDESTTPDDDMKISLTCNENVVITPVTQTITAPVEGGNSTAIAYVNTPGSLYKATSLDANDAKEADALVISGNINNGDISWQGSDSKDPMSGDADAFGENGATVAMVNWGTAPESVDLSDAVIDYRHLRVLRNFGKDLKRVVFPKTLTRIPNNIFSSSQGDGCYNLEEVVFPTEAESFTIGDNAFKHTAIKSLLIPSGVTQVGESAFAECQVLTDVEMEGLKSDCHFGNYVFGACPALKHVTLSEKVTNIGDNMFYQCGLLESIRIPTTCKTIGSNSFGLCYSIHQITIPEGVELIKENAFEGAGLTDIYVMATTPAKVPKIYAMSPTGGGPSTFSSQRTTGNNTVPDDASYLARIGNADYDEVITWYQEDLSGSEGLGTGNCLTALHYPESMKDFYEAIDYRNFPDLDLTGVVNYKTPDEYMAFITNANDRVTLESILNNTIKNSDTQAHDFGTDEEGNPIEYKYLPQSYAIDPDESPTNTDVLLVGPDKDGKYYPIQESYLLRMAAGATGTLAGGVNQGDAGLPVASQWGWRQFPLSSSIESTGEITYEKEYDDTWYTMAFPWRMIDNQLFSAFNQKCEIVEFIGAEVIQDPEDEYNYNLVFHFDEVAKTYYMDDAGVEYDRERDGDRVDAAGHNIYVYTSKVDGIEIRCPEEALSPSYKPKDADPAIREAYGKYLSVQNVMVLPGHPYMIHPSIGAAPGNPAKVYINGVKKIEVGEGKEFATLAEVAESQKVERTVTSNEAGGTSTTAWTNPETGAGGKYTFIGNINDAKDTDVEGHEGAQDMPTENGPVYFLGVKDGTYYPQFFKKPKGKGQGKWSQYSAIIVPDADAIANVEGLDGMAVGSSAGDNSSKGYDVVFGEWEIVDEATIVTAIENAQAEAEETGKPAQITHMNVVYNIKGQVVRADSSSVEGLPKGLYIVNGKKYMVK